MWGSLIDELITTYDSAKGKGCKPVLLLVDEAGRTAIPSLADYATTVVGRGISLWVAVQSLEQLKAEYGEARAQVLLDNMEGNPTVFSSIRSKDRCLSRALSWQKN